MSKPFSHAQFWRGRVVHRIDTARGIVLGHIDGFGRDTERTLMLKVQWESLDESYIYPNEIELH